MAETRYTLSLPAEVYEELKKEADKREMSIKEVVRQCLKFGLIGLKIDADPNTDLMIRERMPGRHDAETEIRETRLQFI
jgi:hypothetical protein